MPEAEVPALERRYRAMVGWYPRGYRDEYADEMVGVLMADSAPGRRWPEPAAVVDLVAGGVRAWLRRGAAPAGEGPWRDAAAVVGLLVPVALLAHLVAGAAQLARFGAVAPPRYDVEFGLQVGAVLPWAAVLVAVLAGRPGAAARLAVAAVAVQFAVWLAMAVAGWQLGLGMEVLGLAGTVALARRPPGQHAVRVLGRRSAVAAAVLASLAVAVLEWPVYVALVGLDPTAAGGVPNLPERLAIRLEEPLTTQLRAFEALAVLLAGVLVALVARRAGLAASVRLAGLATPAPAVTLLLPAFAGPAGVASRLAEVAVVVAAAGALAWAAGAVLTWTGRLLRGPG